VTLIGASSDRRGPADTLPAGTQERLGGVRAFRSPAHMVVLEVKRRLGGPLVLASTGRCSPETADASLDLVIQDGPTYFRKPPTVVRIEGSRWQVVSEGPVSERDLESMLPVHILFVCTGNTCRSPLAEVFCAKLLAERLGCSATELRGRGYVVQSAGLAAGMGSEAAADAMAVAGEYGVDLSMHRSRFLTEDMLARADFLVTMTRSHLYTLAGAEIPGMPAPRLLSCRGEDIPDPIGCDLETYRECARTIWESLHEFLPEFQAAGDDLK
jgi:protein-tyrosine phosphatase